MTDMPATPPVVPRRFSGIALILAATGVAGVVSYLIVWWVPRLVGIEEYKPFGLFWSALYLVIGALSGVQQEISRATTLRSPSAARRPTRSRGFALLVAVLVLLLVIGSAPAWVGLFPEQGWAIVWPLAIGTASYVIVAVLAGSFYGIAEWVPIALLIAVDALLRIVAIGVVSLFSRDIVVLAWAAAIPFVLVPVLLWPFIRRSLVNRTTVAAGYGELGWNVIRTVLASASMGVLVSGFPAVLGATSAYDSALLISTLFLVITLTRAPIIVVVMSLQSYLVVWFRNVPEETWRRLAKAFAAIAGAVLVLVVPALTLGPPVFNFLFPGQYALEGWFYAALVLSSGLVAAVCVTGSLALSRSHHFGYSIGWGLAALLSIACLLLPLPVMQRTTLALLVPPACGLLVHLLWLARLERRDRVDQGSRLR